MVRALLAIVKAFRRVWVLELAAGGLVVAGAAVQWGTGVALLTGGACAGLKAFDLSIAGDE